MPPLIPYNFSVYQLMENFNNFPLVDNVVTKLDSVHKRAPSYKFEPDGIVDQAESSFNQEKKKREDLENEINFRRDVSNRLMSISNIERMNGENYNEDQKNIIRRLKNVADEHGVDYNLLINTALKESVLDPNAKSGGVVGLFQFSKGDWNTVRNKFGKDFNFKDDGRTDITQSARAMALRYKDYERRHVENNLPTDHTSLYMRHFLGNDGGLYFLRNLNRFQKNELEENESPFVADYEKKAAEGNRVAFYKDHREYGTKYPRNYQEFYDYQDTYFKKDWTDFFKENEQ